MSNSTINQPDPSLKGLSQAVEKLGRKIDALTVLAYQNQRLTVAYKQIIPTIKNNSPHFRSS